MSTVKKLKECDMVYNRCRGMPQKALEIRMMRDKPCEKLGDDASGRGNGTVSKF